MRRTITNTADQLRPGDHIQAPNGKLMRVADITDATNAGIPGRYAILLIDPAMAGNYGARLMLINPGHILDIRPADRSSVRPCPAETATRIRRSGISGYEVHDTITGDWVYINAGTWRDEFGTTNREADEPALNRLVNATTMTDPKVERIVTALRSSSYQRTAALGRAPETVPCRRCHAERGQQCRTRTGGWSHGTYHRPRLDDIAHLDEQQRLDAVAALVDEQEQVRQATIAHLDAARPVNRWTELDRKERR